MTRFFLMWAATFVAMQIFPVIGQDSDISWFQVSPKEGALVFFADKELGIDSFSVRDASGSEIDTIALEGDLPFVRQYRLKPGIYNLHIEGLTGFELKLAPGEMQYLRLLSPELGNVPAVLRWPDPSQLEVRDALSELEMKFGTAGVAPVEVAPVGNDLYFRVEPSLVRHPSPRPPRRD